MQGIILIDLVQVFKWKNKVTLSFNYHIRMINILNIPNNVDKGIINEVFFVFAGTGRTDGQPCSLSLSFF